MNKEPTGTPIDPPEPPKAPKPISEYTAEEKKELNRSANPEMSDEQFDKYWAETQKQLEYVNSGQMAADMAAATAEQKQRQKEERAKGDNTYG